MSKRPSLRLSPQSEQAIESYARSRDLPFASAVKKLVSAGLEAESSRQTTAEALSVLRTHTYLLCEMLVITRLAIDGHQSPGHENIRTMAQEMFQKLTAPK